VKARVDHGEHFENDVEPVVMIEDGVGGVERGGYNFLETTEARNGCLGHIRVRDVVKGEGVKEVEGRGGVITDKKGKEVVEWRGGVGNVDVWKGEMFSVEGVTHGRAGRGGRAEDNVKGKRAMREGKTSRRRVGTTSNQASSLGMVVVSGRGCMGHAPYHPLL